MFVDAQILLRLMDQVRRVFTLMARPSRQVKRTFDCTGQLKQKELI
jgi:hypothetical protein